MQTSKVFESDIYFKAKSLFFGLASIALSFFHPVASYALAIISIYYIGNDPRSVRMLGLFSLSHAGALIFSSRDLLSESSDFIVYFDTFRDICLNPQFSNLNDYFPFEPALPSVYFIFSLLISCDSKISLLAYLQSLIISFSFLMILSIYVYEKVEVSLRNIVLTGACLYFPFFMTTQLSRQFSALPFLFAAIYVSKYSTSRFILLMISMLFHTTSIITYGFIIIIRKLGVGVGSIFGLLVTVLVLFYIGPLLEFVISDFGFLIGKISMFFVKDVDHVAGFPRSDLITALIAITVWALIFFIRSLNKEILEIRAIMGAVAFLTLIILPFPLLATRIFLFYSTVLGGFYLFHVLGKVSIAFAKIALMVLILFRVLTWLFIDNNGDHALWLSWPRGSFQPGYFML
jgi:hypothetical protein